MRALLAVLWLGASPFVIAGESVDLWSCPEFVYTDRPCAGGQRVFIDIESNQVAAETRRPSRTDGRAPGPSILMIPRPPPHRFEPLPSTYSSPILSGPSTDLRRSR